MSDHDHEQLRKWLNETESNCESILWVDQTDSEYVSNVGIDI